MTGKTHRLSFDGALLARGFWLYVWEITAPSGEALYYVGRTGDSSSTNAQSPFNRIGQHLGTNKATNQVRTHLMDKGVEPEQCGFRLVTHGPIAREAKTQEEHRKRRDETAAFEKALAQAMKEAGYRVVNTVRCSKPLDAARFRSIRAAFAEHFPKLDQCRGPRS